MPKSSASQNGPPPKIQKSGSHNPNEHLERIFRNQKNRKKSGQGDKIQTSGKENKIQKGFSQQKDQNFFEKSTFFARELHRWIHSSFPKSEEVDTYQVNSPKVATNSFGDPDIKVVERNVKKHKPKAYSLPPKRLIYIDLK